MEPELERNLPGDNLIADSNNSNFMFEFKYSLFYFVFSAIWALYLLGSYNSNSLVQKLSRVLGFYRFSAEQNGFT